MKEPSGFGDGRLVPFADGLWTASTPVRFFGTWFPHVMTVVRLADDNLLLHSPCRPSDGLVSQIAELGRVSHVVAPNWFHDLYLTKYRSLYREATFWGPPFLQRQHPSLVDRTLDEDARPPWFDEMPHAALPGLLTLDECVFFHRPTATLIVADFLMNASADERAPLPTRLGYAFFRLNGNLKVFAILRWFGAPYKARMRRVARIMLNWNPEGVIVGHGVPLAQDAAEQLRLALSWLNR